MSQFGVMRAGQLELDAVDAALAGEHRDGRVDRIGHARVDLLGAEQRRAQLQAAGRSPTARRPRSCGSPPGRGSALIAFEVGRRCRRRRRARPRGCRSCRRRRSTTARRSAARSGRRGRSACCRCARTARCVGDAGRARRSCCALGLVVLPAQAEQRLPLLGELDLVLHVERDGVASGERALVRRLGVARAACTDPDSSSGVIDGRRLRSPRWPDWRRACSSSGSASRARAPGPSSSVCLTEPVVELPGELGLVDERVVVVVARAAAVVVARHEQQLERRRRGHGGAVGVGRAQRRDGRLDVALVVRPAQRVAQADTCR